MLESSLGQVVVVALAVPVLGWLFRRIPERIGTILLSALVAHSAWHWMTERGSVLGSTVRMAGPRRGAGDDVMRALMLVLIVAGAAWLMLSLARRLAQSRRRRIPPPNVADGRVMRPRPSHGGRGTAGCDGLNPLHVERCLY